MSSEGKVCKNLQLPQATFEEKILIKLPVKFSSKINQRVPRARDWGIKPITWEKS